MPYDYWRNNDYADAGAANIAASWIAFALLILVMVCLLWAIVRSCSYTGVVDTPPPDRYGPAQQPASWYRSRRGSSRKHEEPPEGGIRL